MSAHIAVYNDHSSILRLMQVILERAGFRATIHMQRLNDAEDVAALNPDVIVFGYFAGLDLTELGIISAVRAHPVTAQTPIVIVTTLPQFVQQFLAENPLPDVKLLAKPFEGPAFLKAVQQAANRELA